MAPLGQARSIRCGERRGGASRGLGRGPDVVEGWGEERQVMRLPAESKGSDIMGSRFNPLVRARGQSLERRSHLGRLSVSSRLRHSGEVKRRKRKTATRFC